MDIEEKYAKPKIDYYVSYIMRKITSGIMKYPEFIFLFKILLLLLLLLLAVAIFRKYLAIF